MKGWGWPMDHFRWYRGGQGWPRGGQGYPMRVRGAPWGSWRSIDIFQEKWRMKWWIHSEKKSGRHSWKNGHMTPKTQKYGFWGQMPIFSPETSTYFFQGEWYIRRLHTSEGWGYVNLRHGHGHRHRHRYRPKNSCFIATKNWPLQHKILCVILFNLISFQAYLCQKAVKFRQILWSSTLIKIHSPIRF